MPKTMNLIRKRFGRLIVESKHPVKGPSRSIRWDCLCDCGNRIVTNTNNLNKANTTSCGCLRKEKLSEIGKENFVHGMTRTKTYFAWNNAIQRCMNKNHPSYVKYGAKGIKVCQRWLDSFENFLKDMGIKPPGQSVLKRTQSDGDYNKDNCKWVVYETSSPTFKIKKQSI